MIEKLKKLPISTHSTIHTVSLLAGVFIAVVSSQFPWVPGMVIGMILMLGGLVWHFVFLRCPHCGHHFHIHQAMPKYCPNCGKQVL